MLESLLQLYLVIKSYVFLFSFFPLVFRVLLFHYLFLGKLVHSLLEPLIMPHQLDYK